MTAPDLKPCPFCGGVAEQDYQQPYRSISAAKLGKACAIYCMSCSANMTLCHEDHEGVSPDDLMAELVAAWNTRTTPLAEALAVVLDALKDGEVWGRAVNGASAVLNSGMPEEYWTRPKEIREALDAALRAIGEGRNG